MLETHQSSSGFSRIAMARLEGSSGTNNAEMTSHSSLSSVPDWTPQALVALPKINRAPPMFRDIHDEEATSHKTLASSSPAYAAIRFNWRKCLWCPSDKIGKVANDLMWIFFFPVLLPFSGLGCIFCACPHTFYRYNALNLSQPFLFAWF